MDGPPNRGCREGQPIPRALRVPCCRGLDEEQHVAHLVRWDSGTFSENTGPQWLSWEGLGLEKWGHLITTSLVNVLGTQEPESLEEKVP